MGEIFLFLYLGNESATFSKDVILKIFFFRIGRGLGVNVEFFVSFSIFFWVYTGEKKKRKDILFFFLSLQIPFEMKGMSEKRKKVFKEIKI